MVTRIAESTRIQEVQSDNTNIEEIVKEIGLTFWAEPSAFAQEDEMAHFEGIDEELLYAMGYTLGELPGNIMNNSHEFCNTVVNNVIHAQGHISFHELQNEACIYLAGYQAGLRAK
jgi:hypothetical protein